MALRLRREIEEQIIAPVLLLIDWQDVVLDCLQCLCQLIRCALLLISPHEEQLDRRIARALAHAVQCTISQQVARCIHS